PQSILSSRIVGFGLHNMAQRRSSRHAGAGGRCGNIPMAALVQSRIASMESGPAIANTIMAPTLRSKLGGGNSDFIWASSLRHLKPKRLCRDAMLFDARGIAVAAAISAMQRETDGAGALPRQDFVAADM